VNSAVASLASQGLAILNAVTEGLSKSATSQPTVRQLPTKVPPSEDQAR
jgi:hypothetical protein